jgi:ER membrane protein complex subunit 7
VAGCRDDGSFSINNVPEGSYIVEVAHPNYVFDPARVFVKSNGKIKAYTVNHVQPSAARQLRYPLKLRAQYHQPQYFEQREQWLTAESVQQFLPMVSYFTRQGATSFFITPYVWCEPLPF